MARGGEWEEEGTLAWGTELYGDAINGWSSGEGKERQLMSWRWGVHRWTVCETQK